MSAAAHAIDPMAEHRDWLAAYDAAETGLNRAPRLPWPMPPLAARYTDAVERYADEDERVEILSAAYGEMLVALAAFAVVWLDDAGLRDLLRTDGLGKFTPAVVADLRPAVERAWKRARDAGIRERFS